MINHHPPVPHFTIAGVFPKQILVVYGGLGWDLTPPFLIAPVLALQGFHDHHCLEPGMLLDLWEAIFNGLMGCGEVP